MEEQGLQVRHRNGVLQCILERNAAFVDSPSFHAPITQFSFLAIRVKHIGQPLTLNASLTLTDKESGITNVSSYSFTLEGSGLFETVSSRILSPQRLFEAPVDLVYGTALQFTFLGLQPGAGAVVELAYVRIADEPVILRLDGCNNDLGNAGADPKCLGTPTTAFFNNMSDALAGFEQAEQDDQLPISKTFSCRLDGGERLRVEGYNFGPRGLRVLLGRKVCQDVDQTEDGTTFWCTTPPGAGTGIQMDLANGQLPYLRTTATLFDYVTTPSPPVLLLASNIGARHMDLRWKLGSDFWNNTMITGFLIQGRRERALGEFLRNATLRDEYLCPNKNAPEDDMRTFRETPRDILMAIHKESTFPFKESICSEVLETIDGAWTSWGGENGELSYVVANISTTTITDLEPFARYQFRIASLSEDRLTDDCRWRRSDVYGRRQLVSPSVQGDFGTPTSIERTLITDFSFESFSLNKTLNYGPSDKREIYGPRGSFGSEGHYGLTLVGSASVGGCNSTATCVDRLGDTRKLLWWKACYDETPLDNPLFSAKTNNSKDLSCFAIANVRPSNDIAFRSQHIKERIEELTPEDSRGNLLSIERNNAFFTDFEFVLPLVDDIDAAMTSLNVSLFDEDVKMAKPDSALISDTQVTTLRLTDYVEEEIPSCEPVLRLTSSTPLLVGAAWYPRRQLVDEGFEAAFVMRIATPSSFCKIMDGIYTNCRSRGGSGLAFVIQNQSPTALGRGEDGLGYAGIKNSVALEFDTWFDAENLDPAENHISLHARPRNFKNSANHSYSLGEVTAGVPDLTDGRCGIVEVRIIYEPFMDAQRTGQIADNLMNVVHFMTDQFYIQGGLGTWKKSMGLLSVYLYDDTVPILAVPLNLGDTLDMKDGRAWIGFTASTGSNIWQTHDILAWSFTQLRQTSA